MNSDFKKKQNLNIIVYKYVSDKSGRSLNDVAFYLVDKTDLHDLIAEESLKEDRKFFGDLSPQLQKKADDYAHLLLTNRTSSSRRYSMNFSDNLNLGDLFKEAFEEWCASTLPMLPGVAFTMLRKTGGFNSREMEVRFQDRNVEGIEISYLFDKLQNVLYICDANDKHNCKEVRDLNPMTAKRMVLELYQSMTTPVIDPEEEVMEEEVAVIPVGPMNSPMVLSSYLRKIANHIDNSKNISKDKVVVTLNHLVSRLANADIAKVTNGSNVLHRHLEDMKKSLAELNKLQEKYENMKKQSETIDDPNDKSKILNELSDLAEQITEYSKNVKDSTADLEKALKEGVLEPAANVLEKIAM